MAWIETIGFKDTGMTPELMAAYQSAGANLPATYMGGDDAAGIVKAHSLDPEALRTAFGAGMHLLNGPGPLLREEREMVATVVSAANRCFY
jgi:alkylhydroperoxidase family enzyme